MMKQYFRLVIFFMYFNMAMTVLFVISAILNPHNLQRPNVMQSSPSPTSIITNINQSNYLCSQTPDPQTASTPQPVNYKDDVFQHPGNNNLRRDGKQPQFKQVVIVQTQNANVGPEAGSDCSNRCSPNPNFIMNGQLDSQYKSRDNQSPQEQNKQDNYNFKNLAINNCIQDYSNTSEYQNQQLTKDKEYQKDVKTNNFGFLKPKFYLSYGDMGVVQNNISRRDTPRNDFNKEAKNEPAKEKSEDDQKCADKSTDCVRS